MDALGTLVRLMVRAENSRPFSMDSWEVQILFVCHFTREYFQNGTRHKIFINKNPIAFKNRVQRLKT